MEVGGRTAGTAPNGTGLTLVKMGFETGTMWIGAAATLGDVAAIGFGEAATPAFFAGLGTAVVAVFVFVVTVFVLGLDEGETVFFVVFVLFFVFFGVGERDLDLDLERLLTPIVVSSSSGLSGENRCGMTEARGRPDLKPSSRKYEIPSERVCSMVVALFIVLRVACCLLLVACCLLLVACCLLLVACCLLLVACLCDEENGDKEQA